VLRERRASAMNACAVRETPACRAGDHLHVDPHRRQQIQNLGAQLTHGRCRPGDERNAKPRLGLPQCHEHIRRLSCNIRLKACVTTETHEGVVCI